MGQVIIDVRDKDEFHAEHVESSINIPLAQFPKDAPNILKHLRNRDLILMCKTGKRANLALLEFHKLGITALSCNVFDGGILAWKAQGNITVGGKKSHLPIMRQVQLTAGLLVLVGSLLAYFIDIRFLFLTGFIGAGLTLAGSTGFCGMAVLLSKLPWNRKKNLD